MERTVIADNSALDSFSELCKPTPTQISLENINNSSVETEFNPTNPNFSSNTNDELCNRIKHLRKNCMGSIKQYNTNQTAITELTQNIEFDTDNTILFPDENDSALQDIQNFLHEERKETEYIAVTLPGAATCPIPHFSSTPSVKKTHYERAALNCLKRCSRNIYI